MDEPSIITKIGDTTFTLEWDADVAQMPKNHRTRALKLIDAFRAAGENGEPQKRKPGRPSRNKQEPLAERQTAEDAA